MNLFFKYILLISSLFNLGCNQNNEEIKETSAKFSEAALEDISSDVRDKKLIGSTTMKGMKGTANSNLTQQTKQLPTTVELKKIIRQGNVSIETIDIKKSKNNIDMLLDSYNGYYEQEKTSAGSTYINYNLKLRIPSENFDKFIKNLESGNDKITEKSIGAEDISLHYYDVESRLKSKRSYLERYQNLVKSAKSVKELLEIEEQIRQLQEDIESSESKLRNLSGLIKYSTLNIHIYYAEANSSSNSTSLLTKTKDALISGWHLIENLFIRLISLWPLTLILLAMLFFIRKKYWRKN